MQEARDLSERLERETVGIECAMCRHRQWLSTVRGRCDQCGSEILLFLDRDAARAALDGFGSEGRVAYLGEKAGGLYVVIANRAFQPPDDR